MNPEIPEELLLQLVDAWGAGYAAGMEDGYVDAVLHERDQQQRRWARWAAVVAGPDYATVCELRGQPDKAAAVRAFWASTGLAS